MDPTDNAKYLNSPETELFDKGRSLYNHAPARAAAGKGLALIVAEGYMDVIALAEAGFGASVAPLGTAITETQLQLLWRIADEPIIALDGDTAGLRAAMRVIDLALPLLEAGKSVRFAIMPEGMDPDDLIRAKGPGAVQSVLDEAIPMVRLLWQRETEGKVFDSPERNAALDKAIREKLKLIKDPSTRTHYGREIKDLQWDLFRSQRKSRTPWNPGKKPDATPMPRTKSSYIAGADEAMQIQLREAVVLASLIATPTVIAEFESRVELLACSDPDHAALRDILLTCGIDSSDTLKDEILVRLGPGTLEKLHGLRHVAITPCVRAPGDVEKARMTVAEELAKIHAQQGLDAELAEAVGDPAALADEAATWRLGQATEAVMRATRSEVEDTIEYDLGENGAPIKRSEREEFAALLDRIGISKPQR